MHQQVFSQNRAINWAFGDSAGLNFATEPPTPFLSSIKTFEPSATISDEAGNLLFYTNGKTIWNKEHEVMVNGNFLDIGAGTLSTYTQGVIIIPDPSDNLKYYIFHMDFNYIKYTIVDMNFEDGLGLVTSKNNILLEIPGMTEKMQAIRHANGRDWWLVILALPEDGISGLPFNFYEFLITPEGISEPAIREGAIYEDQSSSENIGQMKFNQQGNMLACTNGRNVILYHFDRCSGFFNYLSIIDTIFEGSIGDELYGIEFSPSGSLLFLNKVGAFGKPILYQYCLDSGDIEDSKQIIYLDLNDDTDNNIMGSLQLAINNKIYLAMPGIYDTSFYLSVINNPDVFGNGCNFDTLSVFTGGKVITNSLPNMPNYNLGVMPKSACDTLSTSIENISESTFAIYPNPAQNSIYIKSTIPGSAPFILMDVFGKEVMHTEVLFNYPINISHLPQGIYIAMLKHGEDWVTEKLIKTNEK